MRVLLSTIGSRGDVQPLVALAIELRTLGQEVHFCVPPDFREWIEGLGFVVTPIGPELRTLTTSSPAPSAAAPISPERARAMVDATVAAQFEVLLRIGSECDVIVGATALQIAAPSVAEKHDVPYIFTAYCPTVLPSPHHPPILLGMRGDVAPDPALSNDDLWARDAQRCNDTFSASLNQYRTSIGLAPISDVRSYIFTGHPWLAADPVLGPRPGTGSDAVFQPGAWIIADERPMSPELQTFLDAGEPPVYFGFGSMRATGDLTRTMLESARALGRRAIVSRGWADLALADAEPDCLSIGEVNQHALFARVAAVVHHGGAGTTAAAALAGAPQVVVPQMYDQHYWAKRVQETGIGTAHAPGTPTAESLTSALQRSQDADVIERARVMAPQIRRDGARLAAERVIAIAR